MIHIGTKNLTKKTHEVSLLIIFHPETFFRTHYRGCHLELQSQQVHMWPWIPPGTFRKSYKLFREAELLMCIIIWGTDNYLLLVSFNALIYNSNSVFLLVEYYCNWPNMCFLSFICWGLRDRGREEGEGRKTVNWWLLLSLTCCE